MAQQLCNLKANIAPSHDRRPVAATERLFDLVIDVDESAFTVAPDQDTGEISLEHQSRPWSCSAPLIDSDPGRLLDDVSASVALVIEVSDPGPDGAI